MLLVDQLASCGIDTFFVVTGGAIVPFINSVKKYKYYCFQHEQSAAMAAEGYYRSSGKIACVCVTSGPGVQNIVNGVCGCWYDSIPALFICGQVNTNELLDTLVSKPRQSGFQEMPVCDMFKDVCKYTAQPKTVEECGPIFQKALDELHTPRYGPVVIDLPVNVQMKLAELDFVLNKPLPTPSTKRYHISTRGYVNPLVILGHGVKLAGVQKDAMEFVEQTGIPFVVSWGAFDVSPTDHPQRIGSHGVYGDRVANLAVQHADLLIILGSRLDSRQTGGNFKTFSPNSKKIMVDIDPEEIGKLNERGIEIHTPYISDLSTFFKNLSWDIDYIKWDRLKDWKIDYGVEHSRKNDSDVYDVLTTLFEKFPDNSIIIPDQGGNLIWTMQSAKINKTHTLFTNLGNSSMGFALPCAIGASIANPNKKVICIDGDGGFQMNIQELLTVKKYNLNIDIYILNNSGYGIIKQFQDSYFNSDYVATDCKDVFGERVDFEKIAQSYGVHTLYDIHIPETQRIYPKLEFGNSLENMTPYIDSIPSLYPRKVQGWV